MAHPLNDIRSWNVPDPAPNEHLGEIMPLSRRAAALLVRRRDMPVLRSHFHSVSGAIDMMRGLEYHHGRFMTVVNALAAGDPTHDDEPLRHDAVAYINRAGQFHRFTRSKIVRDLVPDCAALVPKSTHLTKFRDKHTAHRSIDAPYAEDTEHLQIVHARSLTVRGGGLWRPKEPLPIDFMGPFWGRAYLVYQLNMGEGGTFNFSPEADHPFVMSETYAVVERVLS